MWAQQASTERTPRFEDYPVAEIFTDTPVAPILSTPETRQYRTRIRNGVLTGADVWNGSWKNPIKRNGPNFAGHYFVIRWGCGSQCVTMATVDAKTGTVYAPPLSEKGSLYVPLDNLSAMEIDFRPNSSLLVLRNACPDFRNRNSCGTYYFNWKDNRFALVRFVMVNPLKDLP
ncbi:MAG: hypothetical protein JWO19_5023 [Bryobacterales bacterium]|jgi:hypothetical protein|nr:hypothetical protein [Bryobacterales bacterium]